jgi:dipeptidyl aminopeptidase/acylaminoacyl peptidase
MGRKGRGVIQGWWALLLALLLPGVVMANGPVGQGAALPPVEHFFGPEELGGAALSPSGRWLAMAVQPPGQRRGLAVFDLHGHTPPQDLARFSDMDVGRVQWVGDERLVFDLLNTHRGSGEQRLGSGLFSVKRDGSELRQLILMRWWRNPGQGTQASRRLDATHRLLSVPRQQRLGEESVIVRGALIPGNPGSAWVLKRLNVVTGAVESLLAGEPSEATTLFFDTSGQPVFALVEAEGQTEVVQRQRDAAGGLTRQWQRLARAPSLEMPWAVHGTDRAGRLYVTEPQGAAGEAVLKRFDPALGRPAEQPLVVLPGHDFAGYLIEDDEAADAPLLGVRVFADTWTTQWLDPGLAAVQQAVDARLPGRSNVFVCARCRSAERTVVVRSGSDRQPPEWWLWRGTAEAPTVWRRIGSSRPLVDARQMAEVAPARIKARDGLELPLWVTLPQRPAEAGPAAAVVLVHGGPWVRGASWQWQAMPQFLTSRGYVVLQPEFRGSTGYGQRLHRAGWRQWGRAMQDDLADTVAWARDQGLIDPARVCIAGASYGGYAALMGLVRHPEIFRCAAAWVPLTDLRWLLREGSPDDWSDEVRAFMLPRLVADWERDGELLRRISPIEQVERIRAPVLLAWGEEDRRTPPAQAKALRDALTEAGRPPQAVGYEGEGHQWLKTSTHLDFAQRLEAFLEASLKRPAKAPAP